MFVTATNIHFQWSAGEVCFDCPCGEKEIIISESGIERECVCGRIYRVRHFVEVIDIEPPLQPYIFTLEDAAEMYADVCRENNILRRQIEQLEQLLAKKPQLIGTNVNNGHSWINLSNGIILDTVPDDREDEVRQLGYLPFEEIKRNIVQESRHDYGRHAKKGIHNE